MSTNDNSRDTSNVTNLDSRRGPSPGGRRPPADDWMVYAVCDPDGLGREFAYTAGLHAHGLPEVHMWGRPPDGDDPGADWHWSQRDMGHLLNDVARRLVSGGISTGASWSGTYDGGCTTVRFELAHGGVAPELDTLMAEPGTPVLSLRWSLERPEPTPERWPVDERLRQVLDDHAGRVDAAAPTRSQVWRVHEVDPRPQPVDVGAWTGIIHAHRRALLVGFREQHLDVLEASFPMLERYAAVLGAAVAAARLAGRSAELDAAQRLSDADAERLCALAARALDPSGTGLDSSCYRLEVGPMFRQWLAAAYTSLVVADVDTLEPGVLDAGLGWMAAIADPHLATTTFAAEVPRPAAALLGRVRRTLRPASGTPIHTAELEHVRWRGCARAASRGVGAPITVPVDEAIAWLVSSGDLPADEVRAA